MKMDVVAGSGNDEFYTPSYAIYPIMKYLNPNSKVWCPFDTEKSLFVKELKGAGFEVMYFNKRVSYFKDYSDKKPSLNPPFSSVYICRGVLPKQIVFEEINK